MLPECTVVWAKGKGEDWGHPDAAPLREHRGYGLRLRLNFFCFAMIRRTSSQKRSGMTRVVERSQSSICKTKTEAGTWSYRPRRDGRLNWRLVTLWRIAFSGQRSEGWRRPNTSVLIVATVSKVCHCSLATEPDFGECYWCCSIRPIREIGPGRCEREFLSLGCAQLASATRWRIYIMLLRCCLHSGNHLNISEAKHNGFAFSVSVSRLQNHVVFRQFPQLLEFARLAQMLEICFSHELWQQLRLHVFLFQRSDGSDRCCF